jgi:glycosyltransferase involved in cell wall biosynthesis
MHRLHILISAHELSPYQGSECAEGWNLVTRIARYHDVTVLYAKGSQFAPDAYENKNEYNIEFIAVPQPCLTLCLAAINKRISKTGSSIGIPFLYFLGYRFWQKAAYKRVSLIFRLSPFALVHHLTSIHFREPGYLWKLPVPFVWGPTGGTLTIPPALYQHIGLRQTIYELSRNLSNSLKLSCGKRINQAIKKSSLIYAFSEEDKKVFENRGAGRVEIMLDAGCELQHPQEPDSTITHHASRITIPDKSVTRHSSLVTSSASRITLHVLWVGQLIRRKALDILLNAVAGDAELTDSVRITVIGDGPLRAYYETLANNLLLITHHSSLITHHSSLRLRHSSLITFLGQLPREKVFEQMRNADVLVHTSYREATSNVIPEALSCGLPVICHDISGMSIAVTDVCGIKIPLKTYKESVAGFRNALRKLLPTSPNLNHTSQYLTNLKSGALHRASELSWDLMAEQIANDYASIADQS